MAELSERVSSTVNSKIHSDSGYGSNKSNSQSQRSSGSSKSQHSSLSSGSGSGYPPHPNAPVSNADCQPHASSPGGTGSANSLKRQGKKKSKLDRKPSYGEKNESRMSQENQNQVKEGGKSCGSQLMDQGNLSMPSTPQPLSQMSPASKCTNPDSKALQVAALTHALSCMKKFQDHITESEINEDSEECIRPTKVCWQKYISDEVKDASNEDAFGTVVSLDDGVIVYLTQSISNTLGFPKDMLLGRSFIDFVHPKDRMAFASHITCGINFPISGDNQNQSIQNSQGSTVKSEPFYCRLRQYRGLKTVGFGVTDKTVLYHPFKLTMQLKKVEMPFSNATGNRKVFGNAPGITKLDSSSFKETSMSSDTFCESISTNNNGSPAQNAVYLVVEATRIKSAYNYSEEIPKNPGKFVTRHSASCHFGHMDAEAISYLGHLPQDLIGNSVLDYYHPEDMNLVRDIYEAVMQEQGKPFRSKPYRFRAYNGSFAMLETDWSCFINPWSWKLEFVIGQHTIIKGPGNPNVFMQPKDDYDETLLLPEEIISDAKEIQNEIRRKLTETVTRRLSDPRQQSVTRRRKDLAALMETLLEQMAKTENSDKSGSQCSGFSVMERDSVMLGEISPHTVENSGSNHSSSTPPSYNQLNYRENIQRFFQSQPKTQRSDESGESSNKMDVQNQSSESDSKSSPNIDYSSGSNIRTCSGSNESGNDRAADQESIDFESGSLTQELLSRHNEDMEKYMMQRHRESRGKSSMTPGSHKDSRHRHSEIHPIRSLKSTGDSSDFLKFPLPQSKNIYKCDGLQGLKRTGNFSLDGDSQNAAKQPHLDALSDSIGVTMSSSNMLDENGVPLSNGGTPNSINLWPPFSISMTPGVTTASSYRYTYPCYVFANPSLAGYSGVNDQRDQPRVCIPNYPITSMNKQPPQNIPAATTSTTNGNPSIHEMNSPAPPFYFIPGQQQFLPQQVQLMPAGFVYQPISPYGQHPPIIMPLGTMIHPGQSIFMSPQQPGLQQVGGHVSTSMGVLPPTSLNLFATPPVSISGSSISTSSSGILSTSDCAFMKLSKSTSVQISSTSTPSVMTVASGANYSSGNKINLPKHLEIPSTSTAASKIISRQIERGIKQTKLAAESYGTSSSCDYSNSGSGSDESMNGLNTVIKGSNKVAGQCSSDHSMKSENGDDNLKECPNTLKKFRSKEPPWLENVTMTPELSLRYKLPTKDLSDILQHDLQALKLIGKQSPLVNDQLTMLYSDLANDGFSDSLYIDEGISSSSGEEPSGKCEFRPPKPRKKKMSLHQYSRVAIVHEENAPFPPQHLCSTTIRIPVTSIQIPVSSRTSEIIASTATTA